MFRVPSKYSISHFTPISKWVRQRVLSIWNSAPNAFVKPFVSDRSFVFVAGCGHSGTTLVAAKIGNHSRALLLPKESGAFSPVYGAHCSRRVVAEWDYFAQVTRSDVVVEKTPKHVHSVARIRRILPDAKIILTTRNPLDNISSLYLRFGDLEAAIRRWLVDNEEVVSLNELHFVKVVKYEDITTDPENEFKAMCDFIGVEWESGLHATEKSAYDLIEQNGNLAVRARQVMGPIRRNVGGWRAVLNDDTAEVVAKRTGAVAKRLGYNGSDLTK